MAGVVMEEVTKVYGDDFVAVQGMNLDVQDGEFVVFVGPSGCGKSTALRMIAGLEDITSGKVYIDNRLVNDLPPRDRDVAMVFQNYALYPHMNVRDNLGFALKMRKVDKLEINRRIEEAAWILGIEELLDRKPKALSGGQRQRVALGRAIVREPNVFLMDEPLSNLDAKLRVHMRTEIRKLHNRTGTTTIYVTHDQTEAMTMADRVVVLREGIVQQAASPQEMYEHPTNVFVAGFIGSPAMNFIRARLEKDNRSLNVVFANTKISLPWERHWREENLERYVNGEVVLGIRPEHIQDVRSAENMERSATLDVKPQVIESMGHEKYLYFELSEGLSAPMWSMGQIEADVGRNAEGMGEMLVARVSPEVKARRGEEVKLVVDVDKVHLFDGKTEKAIF
jgi:multiple sugar transport system ATP-binding protein